MSTNFYSHGILLLFLYMGMVSESKCQTVDDFEKDIIDTDIWSGDVSHFSIDDGTLRLNAPEGSTSSFIYTSLRERGDSMVYSMTFSMSFSASSKNKLRIHLALEDTSSSSRGYFLELGETGSKDALKLYRYENEVANLIGSGEEARHGKKVGTVRLKVERYGSKWNIYTQKPDESEFFKEISLEENSIPIESTPYFGVECFYTSTRRRSFYFDDVFIDKYRPDVTPPTVRKVEILSSTTADIHFDEKIDVSQARIAINTSETLINTSEEVPLTVSVESPTRFSAQETNALHVQAVRDLSGNTLRDTTIYFDYARRADSGSIIITEILTDPFPEEGDFIELYNRSKEHISLDSCLLWNTLKERSVTLDRVTIQPHSYLALATDKTSLIARYTPQYTTTIIETKLPSMDNDEATIVLYCDDQLIDSMNYQEDYHFSFLGDTEGISLERIDLDTDASGRDNWHSAATEILATPGYQNTSFVEKTNDKDILSFQSTSISPDNDGFEDALIASYTLESPGYTAFLHIYTVEGIPIATLANNRLLGTQGSIIWDGIMDSGDRSPMGHYILAGKLFHAHDDKTIYIKKAFAVVYKF